MKTSLNEALPAAIPEYPVNIAGHSLKLRFDVNINKTKKGIKLQFVLGEVPQDPRKLQDLSNDIGTELQKKFGDAGLQIVYDVENPYKNVIGFLLPLPSAAEFIMSRVLGGDTESAEDKPEEELPPAEQGPSEESPEQGPDQEREPVKEILMRRAGLK